jgi:lysophospholipase
VLHGYGDHSGRFAHFKRWMADRGVASDGFDFRGHGLSGGRRGFVRRWDEYLDDVSAVLAARRPAWQAEGLSHLPLFVLGHSHGGLILAAAGIRGLLPPGEVAGCVMSAPWLAPATPLSWPWRVFAGVSNLIAPAVRVATGLSPDMMTTDPAMIADSRADPLLLRAATPRWYATAVRAQAEAAARAGEFRPLLCLIGDHDRVASPEAARRFVDRAGSADKAFDLLPGARHEILRETARDRTFARVLAWMTDRLA